MIWGNGMNMKWIKCTFILLCLLIAIYVGLWSAGSHILIVDNHQRIENYSSQWLTRLNTTYNHSTNQIQGLHPINKTVATAIREKVKKIMRPWQTIQIFQPHLNPRRMRFPKTQGSRKTEGIERRVKSCAVVGNSGILLKSSCGHVIDDMDLVIRMNVAEFGHEYSSDVGSKVSFMTINKEQLIKMLACSNMTELKAPLQNDTIKTKQNETIIHIQCTNMVKRLKMLNNGVLWLFKGSLPGIPKVLRYLMKKFEFKLQFAYSPYPPVRATKKVWKTRHPSSGLGLYTASTQLCDEINLFGFYPFYKDRYNQTILHHYYEPELTINYTENAHAMPKEYNFLVNLEKRGAIRMINNCTSSVNG